MKRYYTPTNATSSPKAQEVGGSCPPPWKYFGPSWATCAPPENCTLNQTNTVGSRRRPFRKHLLLGQKRGPNPAETFFLENAYFWDKKAVQIRRRPSFFFREHLFLRQKRGPNSKKFPSIWRSRFCLSPVQK